MKYDRVNFGGHNRATQHGDTLSKIQLVKAVAGSAEHVAQVYGLKINPRTHRAVCPFHPHDNNPDENLSFKGEGFHCFVCGASGSSLDYVQRLFGLSTITDAARRLDADLNLGVFSPGPAQVKVFQASRNRVVSSGCYPSDEDLALAVTLETLLYEIWYNGTEQRLDEEDYNLAQRAWRHEISTKEHDALFAELEERRAKFWQLPEPEELTADQALSLFRGEEEDALNGTVCTMGVSPR